jgi:hypothetical protein
VSGSVAVQPAEGTPAELYAAPSREQLFWTRHLAWLFAPPEGRPSLLARAWGVVAVAPFAHITFFSLSYQAYLYDVFHQTKNARFWHQLCMPLNNLMIMAALAPLDLAGLNGGAVYALVLLAWYLAQAIANRLLLWGLLMIPVVGALYAGAGLYLQAMAAPGWLPSPFVWMAVLSFAQAFSHVTEARLPPRVSASARWKTVREFVTGDPATAGGRPLRILRLVAQAVWGTAAELWASPRLLPFGVLAQLRRRGYARAQLAELDDMTHRAIASGQPAVDFIGSGGGAFLRAPTEADTSPRDGVVPPRWRKVFIVELPLTLGACAYWALAGAAHLETTFGAGAATAAASSLLAQLTAVVFSLVVWFYGRWLLSRGDIPLRPFRYLQEGFAIGDVALIWVAADSLMKGLGSPAVWIAQATMAAVWLAIRVAFLVRASAGPARR